MLWLSSEAAMLLCKGWGKDSCTPLFPMFCPYVTLCYCWRYIARVSRRRENLLVSLHGRPLAWDLHNTQCSRPAHRHPHSSVCPPQSTGRGVRPGRPSCTTHPAHAPLSKEFLMSLTSTWEPGTLKIPCCWRPGKEQWVWQALPSCHTAPPGKQQQKLEVDALREKGSESKKGTEQATERHFCSCSPTKATCIKVPKELPLAWGLSKQFNLNKY